jgi:hypothetical protein
MISMPALPGLLAMAVAFLHGKHVPAAGELHVEYVYRGENRRCFFSKALRKTG